MAELLLLAPAAEPELGACSTIGSMSAYLTEGDLADLLQVDEKTVTEWRRRYSWPHIKIGRRIRYSAADIDAIERLHRPAVASSRSAGLPGQTARSVARTRL